MMNEWNYTREQADQAYFDVQALAGENDANAWISPWLGILGEAADCSADKELVSCGNGLVYNISSGEAVLRTDRGMGIPPAIIIPTADGGMSARKFNNSNMGVSALLYPTGVKSYKCVLGSQELLTAGARNHRRRHQHIQG